MTARNNPPHPTWQWIFTTVISILVIILGYFAISINSMNVRMATFNAHLADHPNVAIEQSLKQMNETLIHMDDRLDDLETFQVYGPPPPR